MIVYKNLHFPTKKNKPYFFSNFVTTIDGRAAIKNTDAYLPIGSDTDFETFLDLRKYADVLIHGKHTASSHRTVDTIAQKKFLAKRKKQGKTASLPYFIISNTPDVSLLPALINNSMQKPYIVTNEKVKVSKNIADLATIIRFGENRVDLSKLSAYLYSQGYKHVLVEGGPTLLGSFLSLHLIDEIFITIAPKVFNGKQTDFFTMTEGELLEPHTLLKWNLLSVKAIHNELFLRYKLDPETSSG